MFIWKIPVEKCSFWSANNTKYFSESNVQIIFQILDEFLVFWMDDLLIYSPTKEEHLKHLELVFEKFREATIK